jgi:hypothetical protein
MGAPYVALMTGSSGRARSVVSAARRRCRRESRRRAGCVPASSAELDHRVARAAPLRLHRTSVGAQNGEDSATYSLFLEQPAPSARGEAAAVATSEAGLGAADPLAVGAGPAAEVLARPGPRPKREGAAPRAPRGLVVIECPPLASSRAEYAAEGAGASLRGSGNPHPGPRERAPRLPERPLRISRRPTGPAPLSPGGPCSGAGSC